MRIPFVGAGSVWRRRGLSRLYGPFRGIASGGYRPHNYLRQTGMLGAVAATPGTLPIPGWSASSLTGLTRSVVGTGVEDGLPYIDIRLVGTSGATYSNSAFITFEGANILPAVSGQTWTATVYAKLAAGSMSNAGVRLRISETNGSTSQANSSQTFTPTTAGLVSQRTTVTRTLNNAATTNIQSLLSVDIANGAAVDFTIRIGVPQLLRGPSPAVAIVTTGAAVPPASME